LWRLRLVKREEAIGRCRPGSQAAKIETFHARVGGLRFDTKFGRVVAERYEFFVGFERKRGDRQAGAPREKSAPV